MRIGNVQLMRLAAVSTLAIGALVTPPAANALTQIYNISTNTQLVGQPSTCAALSYYNGCNAGVLPGFAWTDSIPAGSVINSVKVEFSAGIDCNATGTVRNTRLNATSGPNYNSVADCFCNPTENIETMNMPVSAYSIGAVNTWVVTNPITCVGNSQAPAIGNNYARITVDYGAGGPSTCADQNSVNRLETKLDDGTRFSSDTERNAQITLNTTQHTAIQTQITTATSTISTKIDTSTAALTAEINANEAKIDKLESKADAQSAEIKAAQRMLMENALLNIDRTFIFYSPASCGGRLEQVMAYVDDVIQKSLACDMSVGNAQMKYQGCVDAYNAGQWKNAFDNCRQAYRDVVTGN